MMHNYRFHISVLYKLKPKKFNLTSYCRKTVCHVTNAHIITYNMLDTVTDVECERFGEKSLEFERY